ncbi:MAG: HYR domain-containing protein [Chloroflexi bacterium]|nr:HYR domain-containing protein [Chloroflexota bacterium]
MKQSFKKSFMFVLTVLALIVSALDVAPAFAASPIEVTNANDSGAGSLRQAINDVDAGGTITFNSSLSGSTITISSVFNISKNMTIDGAALASQVTLNGGGTQRVFYVNAGSTLTLKNVTVANGYADYGGGIFLNGSGSLVVENGLFTGNTANGGYGGAIASYFVSGNTVTINNSTFSGNNASIGGAAFADNGGTVTITGSTFTGNNSGSLGGAIFNAGSLTLLSSTLSGNSSGNGSAINNDSTGTLTVKNSTLSNNIASSEGTIRNLGIVTITNSTLSGNSAPNGGAIANYPGATLTLINSTLSNNSATGIGGNIINSGTLNYSNTIIANATAGEDCISLKGGMVGTNINNLVEDGGCSASLSGDPGLDTLANNGGATQTMSLLSGSSAIDAGDNTICAASPVNGLDQRGVTRDSSCDIGAYEYAGGSDTTAPLVTVPDNITAEATSASGAAVNFTVSAEDDVDGTLTPSCDANSGDTFPLGTTTVTCTATDAASNTGSASFDILVEDTTAPSTTIDSQPTNPSSSSAAVFTFSGSDSASGIASFECQVDGGGFAVCNSGDDFGPLSDGAHTFEVRAIDNAGNTDASPASYTWMISTYVASERAKNGGFNTYVGASVTPKFWVSQNFAGTDGKSLTVNSEGTASVRMNAATVVAKTLLQTLNLSGSAGDKFTFSFKEKGNAIPAEGICRGQVFLYNGTTLVNAKTINCAPGTHVFTKHALTFTASGDYTQVVIKFMYKNLSGSVWFDAVSLKK